MRFVMNLMHTVWCCTFISRKKKNDFSVHLCLIIQFVFKMFIYFYLFRSHLLIRLTIHCFYPCFDRIVNKCLLSFHLIMILNIQHQSCDRIDRTIFNFYYYKNSSNVYIFLILLFNLNFTINHVYCREH